MTQRLLPFVVVDVVGPIMLGQLLKFADVVGTGGEAKARIAAGQVSVNGVVEKRRGRQLQTGDVVEVAGRRIRLSCGSGSAQHNVGGY